ncbi:hypothetical protein ACO2Q1_07765 [Brevundimonas sp. VNH65]|uniref:hypothetical protein n=1 Tax=Brevundimonas sp. VNH65 TaxID=3400917 RepID=UPI003C049B47
MTRITGHDVAAGLARARAALDAATAKSAAACPDAGRAPTAAPPLLLALEQAREGLDAAGAALSVLADKMGMEPLAVGPLDKPEDSPPIGGGPRPSRAR